MRRTCMLMAIAWSTIGMQLVYFQTQKTSYFRIKYEKTVSSRDASKVGTLLEGSYAKYKKIFDISLSGRVDVTVYSSVERMKRDSKVPLFDDGVFRNGKMFMLSPSMIHRPAQLDNLIARMTSRAVLFELKACPHWLAECYSVYCGGNLPRYGAPSRLNVVSFADLAEDYSRAERPSDFRDAYAKLAITASFLVDRYGLEKFESVFEQLKKGVAVEVAFEAIFGEKIGVIEKAWVKALSLPVKD